MDRLDIYTLCALSTMDRNTNEINKRLDIQNLLKLREATNDPFVKDACSAKIEMYEEELRKYYLRQQMLLAKEEARKRQKEGRNKIRIERNKELARQRIAKENQHKESNEPYNMSGWRFWYGFLVCGNIAVMIDDGFSGNGWYWMIFINLVPFILCCLPRTYKSGEVIKKIAFFLWIFLIILSPSVSKIIL